MTIGFKKVGRTVQALTVCHGALPCDTRLIQGTNDQITGSEHLRKEKLTSL